MTLNPYMPLSRMTPLSQITPFTHADGLTYLKVLESLKNAMERVADTQIIQDTAMATLIDDANRLIDDLAGNVASAIANINDVGNSYTSVIIEKHDALMALAAELEPLIETSARLDAEIADREADTLALTELVDAEATARASSEAVITTRLSVVEKLTPEYFGAVAGTDVDSTDALKEFMATGYGVMPARTYKIRGDLNLGEVPNGWSLNGNGATFLVAADDEPTSRVLSVTGDNVEITGITVRGMSGAKIRGGIYVYGDSAKVKNNTIENLRSDNESRAIHVEGNGGHHIDANTISNIRAAGDGSPGNGTGMARAIVVYHRGNALLPTHVGNNKISEILGEEGDGITILASNAGGGLFLNSLTTVYGNQVDNCSRRLIKVQGSTVDVIGNVLVDSGRLVHELPASAINVYSSYNVALKGNIIHPGSLGESINVQGNRDGGRGQFITVDGNTIFGEIGSTDHGIFVDYTDRVYVDNNQIFGGYRGVSLGNVSSGSVSGNTTGLIQQTSGAGAVSIAASCNSILMVGNRDTSLGDGGAGIFNTHRNDSVGGKSGGNVSIGTV